MQSGEYWRLGLANFQSFGLLHFGALAVGLLLCGTFLEKIRGPWVLLTAWAAGSAGGFGWAAVVPHAWPMYGGSVGFVGVVAAMMVLMTWGRDVPPSLRGTRRLNLLVLGLGALAFVLEFLVIDNPVHLGGALGGLVVGGLALRGSRLTATGVVAAGLLAWGLVQVVVDVRSPTGVAERYVAVSEGHCGGLGELAFVVAADGLTVRGLREGLTACDEPWSAAGLAALDDDEEAFEMALRMAEPDARPNLQDRWNAARGMESQPE